MPKTTKDFLSPKLIGERFDGHSIPLEVLRDLSVLQDMVIELSKAKFYLENPDRQRVPPGYGKGVSLKITSIEEGSAIPVLKMEYDSAVAEPLEIIYFEEARDTIIRAVSAASKGEDVVQYLDQHHLSYFDRFGRSLEHDEAIDLAPGDHTANAILTRETRKTLVEASRVEETTEEMVLRGGVEEFDQGQMTCKIALASGQRLKAKVPQTHFDVVMQAFSDLKKNNLRASFEGIVRLDKQRKPSFFEEIQHITIIEPNDVNYRLDEIDLLEDGWYNGEGKSFASNELSNLANLFEKYSPEKLPDPYIYPTIAGNLLAEWSLESGVEATLEISTGNESGELTVFDGQGDIVVDSQSINLDSVEDWNELTGSLLN